MGLSVPFLVKIEVLKDVFNDLVTVFNSLEQGEEFAGGEGFAAPRIHLHEVRQKTGGRGNNSTSPSGSHGSNTVAVFDKCRMDVGSLGTPMTLRTKKPRRLLQV